MPGVVRYNKKSSAFGEREVDRLVQGGGVKISQAGLFFNIS